MSRFYGPVKIMLLTSYADIIAAYQARCDVFAEKCENKDIGKTDTFS